MEKLKISALPDNKPVKVTLELPAQVHRDLVAYAEVFSQKTSQKVEPAIALMVGAMNAEVFLSILRAYSWVALD